jgi:hypothetical protein
MSIPHKHHFIPAFYLRQWCDHTGKLIEYTIKYSKLIPKPVGPDATGYEFDLYAFPELPGTASLPEREGFELSVSPANDKCRAVERGGSKTLLPLSPGVNRRRAKLFFRPRRRGHRMRR